MLGVALPTLLETSRGTEPSGMTPWLLPTSSACDKYENTIMSCTTVHTVSLL